MRVGVTLPSFGPLSVAPGVVALARVAEEAGADSLWVPDHLCIPRDRTAPYPYSADGELPFAEDTPWFDCLTVLAAAAAATDRIRLGTAILVLTQRSPLEIGKVAASLDRISGGRLTLGVAAGWFEDEIRALGYEPRRRGRRLDDAMATLRDCWSGLATTHEGGLIFRPTPERGTIPLLVGGSSPPALRRAAVLGDGWIPDGSLDMVDFAALARDKAHIAQLRAEAGLEAAPFEHVLVVDGDPARAAEIGEIARRARALGFDEVIVEAPFEDPPAVAGVVAAVRAAARG